MIIKMDVMTEEEVTEFISEKGEIYGKMYDKMSPIEIFLDRILNLAEMEAKHDKEG